MSHMTQRPGIFGAMLTPLLALTAVLALYQWTVPVGDGAAR